MKLTDGPIVYRLENIGNDLEQIVMVKTDTPELRQYMLEPHVVDAVSLVLCLKGRMRFKINFKEHILEQGMFLIALPNSLIEPIDVSDDLLVYSALYNEDYVSSIPISTNFDVWYKLRNIPCIHLTPMQTASMKKSFDFMYSRYNDPNLVNRKEIVRLLLVAYRVEIRGVYSKIEDGETVLTRTEQITRDFFSLLYEHFKKERNIAFYANLLHLSPKYLASIVREQTGYSILIWVNQAVISVAKFLLKSTDKTVQEIAFELNFSDSSIFCRYFKRNTSQTPGEYRSTD